MFLNIQLVAGLWKAVRRAGDHEQVVVLVRDEVIEFNLRGLHAEIVLERAFSRVKEVVDHLLIRGTLKVGLALKDHGIDLIIGRSDGGVVLDVGQCLSGNLPVVLRGLSRLNHDHSRVGGEAAVIGDADCEHRVLRLREEGVGHLRQRGVVLNLAADGDAADELSL